MDYIPTRRPSNLTGLFTAAAVLIAVAAGPATIIGGVMGVNLHDTLRYDLQIPGDYKVFGLPSAFASFIVGAAVTVAILAVLFVLAVRQARLAPRPAPHYPATNSLAPGYTAPAPKTAGTNVAIGLSFVVAALGVAAMIVVGIFVLVLAALSQANLPM